MSRSDDEQILRLNSIPKRAGQTMCKDLEICNHAPLGRHPNHMFSRCPWQLRHPINMPTQVLTVVVVVVVVIVVFSSLFCMYAYVSACACMFSTDPPASVDFVVEYVQYDILTLLPSPHQDWWFLN
eukprot:m.158839 g.158839  ORF g.158839 m.158839 type:complete len:126 (+) comp17986_c0_seq1:366-743(+)